jgi:hypothetical protein
MRPTALVLFVLSLLLAGTAVLVYHTPNPFAAGQDGRQAELLGSSTLMIALFAAAGIAALLAWAMLWFGGKGYTETKSQPVRR